MPISARSLFLASRPKTLLASLAPILIGISYAMSAGYLSPFILLLTTVTALLIQISCNFANDYFDALKGADTPERKGPLRITEAGLVSKEAMKKIVAAIFLLTAFSGCLLSYYGGGVIAIVTGVSIILSLIYTAGPFPLAYKGLGELFVFIFFGPIATSGTYYLQTREFSSEAFWIGIIPGALSCAILVINNLRDIEEDAKASKKTLAVRFGEKFAKKEYFFMLALAYATSAVFTLFYPFMALVFLTIPLSLKLGLEVARNQEKEKLNPLLFGTSQLLFLFAILLSIGKML